jgi:hypothetical protein
MLSECTLHFGTSYTSSFRVRVDTRQVAYDEVTLWHQFVTARLIMLRRWEDFFQPRGPKVYEFSTQVRQAERVRTCRTYQLRMVIWIWKCQWRFLVGAGLPAFTTCRQVHGTSRILTHGAWIRPLTPVDYWVLKCLWLYIHLHFIALIAWCLGVGSLTIAEKRQESIFCERDLISWPPHCITRIQGLDFVRRGFATSGLPLQRFWKWKYCSLLSRRYGMMDTCCKTAGTCSALLNMQ